MPIQKSKIPFCGEMMCFRKLIFLATILATFVVSAPSAFAVDWYGAGWEYRKEIVIDKDKVDGTSSHTNFPVLVSVTDSDIDAAQADGDDFVFTLSDGTTKLSHEIESYSASGGNGTLLAWVEVPSLSATADTTIYLYYGNSSAANQEDVAGTWTHYKGVYHLEEDASGVGTSGLYANATSGSHAGTDQVSSTNKAGKFGNGQGFDGVDDYIDIPYSTDFTYNGSGTTVSFWMKSPEVPDGELYPLVSRYSVWRGKYDGWHSYIAPNGTIRGVASDGDRNASRTNHNAGNHDDDQWHYVSVIFKGYQVVPYVYVDGVYLNAHSSANDARNANANTSIRIGKNDALSALGYDVFGGNIDEVRVAYADHRGAWTTTEYNNQNDPGTFYALGSQEQIGSITRRPSSAHSVVLASDDSVDLRQQQRSGTQTVRVKKGAIPIVDAPVDFSQKRDFSAVTAEVDEDNAKAVVHFSGSDHGHTGAHTLYIPRKNTSQVRFCPEAQELPDISSECANGELFNPGESRNGITVSVVAFGSEFYYKLEGVTGSGGQGEGGAPVSEFSTWMFLLLLGGMWYVGDRNRFGLVPS